MNDNKLRALRRDTGEVTAILGTPGRIYTPVVWIDSPIRVHKIPNGEVTRYCRDIPNPPPLKRAANRMLKAGKALGITKAAKTFLRAAKVQP